MSGCSFFFSCCCCCCQRSTYTINVENRRVASADYAGRRRKKKSYGIRIWWRGGGAPYRKIILSKNTGFTASEVSLLPIQRMHPMIFVCMGAYTHTVASVATTIFYILVAFVIAMPRTMWTDQYSTGSAVCIYALTPTTTFFFFIYPRLDEFRRR